MNGNLIDLSDPIPSAPSAPVEPIQDIQNTNNTPIGPTDLLYQNSAPMKIPMLIQIQIVFKSDWHPKIPLEYPVTLNCYTNSTWRYIRNIYANIIQVPECSLFLSNNGIAFDADMTPNDYSIYTNFNLEAYLVPGVKL
ncbi:hypothetical protein CPAV1605_513 [seawater metagenome]|uniref:Uncharacterized protein n=1 Tax=seawater metagenome TaxID=1561972 RepID=A0A5E8CHB4_9ZZZZ